MVKRQTYILAITAILAFACIPALSQEPNSSESNKIVLKYETGEPNQLYRLPPPRRHPPGSKLRRPPPRKVLRPTHMAEMFMNHISGLPNRNAPAGTGIRNLLETTAGRGFSEEQRRFFKETNKWIRYGRKEGSPEGYMYINLYAVSEQDAKRLAEAVVEFLDKQARKNREILESRIRGCEEKIPQIKKELKKQREDMEELGVWIEKRVEGGLRKLKLLGTDFDAAKESKETVLKMDKFLNSLQIEISGIKAKLEAVDEYRKNDALGANNLAKLEQIHCEQTIELVGALARKRTAIEIRTRENEFYHKCERWDLLKPSVRALERNLSGSESKLQKAREELNSGNPALDPLKVFENKAVIYPVKTTYNALGTRLR